MTAAPEQNALRSVIGIVTALPKELNAVYAAFGIHYDPSRTIVRGNRRYESFELRSDDGSLHDIILTEPSGMGTNNAAITTANLLSDFPDVRDVVLVGIAGAVPNPEKPETHVRLGDVVILGDKGVIQYDNVKIHAGGKKEHRHHPRPPSQRLLNAALFVIRADDNGTHLIDPYLASCSLEYQRPADSLDILRDGKDASPTDHPNDTARRPSFPRLFVGPIGSANILLKDFTLRNELRDQLKVFAIEMESSGAADACHNEGRWFFAVRGTCDYCNQDKENDWHLYAAYVAAATLHCILRHLPGTRGTNTASTKEVFDPESAALLRERATGLSPTKAHPASETVPVSPEAVILPEYAVLPPAQLPQRRPDSEKSFQNERRELLLRTAREFNERLARLAAQLDFPVADLVARDCEQWIESNVTELPNAVLVELYTSLARQAFVSERLSAAKAGEQSPNHDRSKKFLALAQRTLQ